MREIPRQKTLTQLCEDLIAKRAQNKLPAEQIAAMEEFKAQMRKAYASKLEQPCDDTFLKSNTAI